MSSSKDTIIFDLDGTLARIGHRMHYIEQEEPDYEKFYQASDKDGVYEEVAQLFRLMKQCGYTMVIASGRGEQVRKKTVKWLARYGIFPNLLLMRALGDHRADVQVKSEWLKKELDIKKVLFVVEDRNRVVEMWRSKGLTCFQVNFGDY